MIVAPSADLPASTGRRAGGAYLTGRGSAPVISGHGVRGKSVATCYGVVRRHDVRRENLRDMTDEPENLTLQLLRRLDSKVDALSTRLESLEAHADATDEKLDMLARAFAASEKRLSDQIVGLRRAVVEYHSSAIGHGVLFQELEDRVRRLEEKTGGATSEPH